MIANFVHRLKSRIGIGGVVAIAIAILLFLPFSVIGVTRLTGWSVGIALVCALAVNLVPVVGQLAYVGLAVVGAFLLGQGAQSEAPPAVAAVRQAPAPVTVPSPPPPPPAPPPAANAKAPTDKFTEWKRTVAAPAIEANCVEQAGRRGLVEGKQIEQMARVCACYGAAAVNIVTEADVVDNMVKPTPSLNARLSDEARRLCQS